MNAHQCLMAIIVKRAKDDGFDFEEDSTDITENNVEELFDELVEDDSHYDYQNELREGEVETGIPCSYSRHYESKSVAAKAPDGTWIGWTYWYGGGKYGEPEGIDWISEAYLLDVTEEEKMVTVRTFTKKDEE
jgi:hypothetical protein